MMRDQYTLWGMLGRDYTMAELIGYVGVWFFAVTTLANIWTIVYRFNKKNITC
jgi:hypothetical protein